MKISAEIQKLGKNFCRNPGTWKKILQKFRNLEKNSAEIQELWKKFYRNTGTWLKKKICRNSDSDFFFLKRNYCGLSGIDTPRYYNNIKLRFLKCTHFLIRNFLLKIYRHQKSLSCI